MKRASSLSWAFVLYAALFSASAAAQQKFVTIGTGGVTGVYYATGGAICRLMNKDRSRHGIRCLVESTDGSLRNLSGLRSGEFEFGIVQGDAQFQAAKGSAQFRDLGPMSELRTVFSLYVEPLTLVVRKDSGIGRVDELRGKRFNVGNPGSGTRASVDALLAALGLRMSDFAAATELKPDEHGAALCDKLVDGFAYMVGHPAVNLQDTTATCDAQLLPVSGPAVDRLLKEHPYYIRTIIPGGLYAGNPTPTPTYGATASLATSARVPDAVVYEMVKSVFDHIADFRRLHPALAPLDPREMIQASRGAPLHPGALRYYRERGWL